MSGLQIIVKPDIPQGDYVPRFFELHWTVGVKIRFRSNWYGSWARVNNIFKVVPAMFMLIKWLIKYTPEVSEAKTGNPSFEWNSK